MTSLPSINSFATAAGSEAMLKAVGETEQVDLALLLVIPLLVDTGAKAVQEPTRRAAASAMTDDFMF